MLSQGPVPPQTFSAWQKREIDSVVTGLAVDASSCKQRALNIGPPYLSGGGGGSCLLAPHLFENLLLWSVCVVLLSFLHWICIWPFFILQGWEGNFFSLVLSASGQPQGEARSKQPRSADRVGVQKRDLNRRSRGKSWVGSSNPHLISHPFPFFLLPGPSAPPEVFVPFFPTFCFATSSFSLVPVILRYLSFSVYTSIGPLLQLLTHTDVSNAK